MPEFPFPEQLYGNVATIDERHRHRYEVNPAYVERLEEKGLKFVGKDTAETRMEIVELEKHPYYVGVQFHPEYLSRPLKPSPPFMGLILAAKNKLKPYLANGARVLNKESTTSDYEESSGECGWGLMRGRGCNGGGLSFISLWQTRT